MIGSNYSRKTDALPSPRMISFSGITYPSGVEMATKKDVRYSVTPLYYQVNNIIEKKYMFLTKFCCKITLETLLVLAEKGHKTFTLGGSGS